MTQKAQKDLQLARTLQRFEKLHSLRDLQELRKLNELVARDVGVMQLERLRKQRER